MFHLSTGLTSDGLGSLSLQEVHLVSEKGQLKDKSQLSPEGYYALPVYDSGTFRLKIHGPPGWSFDPVEVYRWDRFWDRKS